MKVKRVYLKNAKIGQRFFRVHTTKRNILTDFVFEKIDMHKIKSLMSYKIYDVSSENVVAVKFEGGK